MEKGDYSISDIYQGGYSSFNPEKSPGGDGYAGMHVPVGQLAITTDPQNANLVKEIGSKINLGLKNIEVEALIPRVFEAMPKQHFKETKQQAKLAGIDLSFHGPVLEPSGMSQQGFSEANRQQAENQITQALERLHEANPKNAIVNFHTSNLLPSPDFLKKEGKLIEDKTIIVNKETGELGRLQTKERMFPGEEEKSIESELKHKNEESWGNSLRHLSYYSDLGVEGIEDTAHLALMGEAEAQKGVPMEKIEKMSQSKFNRASTFIQDSYRELKNMFEIAYKQSTPEEKRRLDQLRGDIEKDARQIQDHPHEKKNLLIMKNIIDKGLETLGDVTPQMFEKADDFMREKTSKSFGNAAFKAYKKFKDDAPILSIENPPATQQFSRAEDVVEIVKKAREQFVKAAVDEGLSKSSAEQKAKKFIGATMDVGHTNMLRGKGFSEKEIEEEAKKFAPFIKHVHLSDNFGFEHTELPMGMGNVPMKKIMENLGEKGFKAKKIIEAGDWWTQHMPKGGGTPIGPSLEAMGSPIYSMKMGPSWNQAIGLYQGYFGGYGGMLPQKNYAMFGAGFSQLPAELGGNIPGEKGGRMSGTPME